MPASAEAMKEKANLLLTRIMIDHDEYCRPKADNLEACVENSMPRTSTVDSSSEREGQQKCQKYRDDMVKCMTDERRHKRIVDAASQVPSCADERNAVAKCKQLHPNNKAKCEREFMEMLTCGLEHIVQQQKGKALSK
jgi:hypothetical protein